MRKIAVVGAGPAGLLAAIALHDRGYDVTVVSDRTADQWLNEARPTGTAAIHRATRDIQKKYGLNFYDDVAPEFYGIDLHYLGDGKKVTVRATGELAEGPGHAIDLRLQCHDWIDEFVRRGGKFVHHAVTLEDLEDMAASNDLILLAAGKNEVLGRALERDADRSVYDKPQRMLTMLNVTGGEFDTPFRPVKFNFFAPYGEYFWVPYYSAIKGKSWSLVIEAKEGGPLDRFLGKVKTGEEAVDIAKKMIGEMAPYEWAFAKDIELTDERGWLTGKFPPTVRKPFGRLPSGRVVAPIGDMVMACDPIGGLGANCGLHYSEHLINRIIDRGDGAFDAAWLAETFEAHYGNYGGPAYTFNNMLLEPLGDPMKEILIASFARPGIGTDLLSRFNRPKRFFETPMLTDMAASRRYVEKLTGGSWRRAAWAGRAKIALHQMRQTIARRPLSPTPVV